MTPFWSAFTEAWNKKDIVWIENTMKKLKLLWLIVLVTALIMLIFSNLFYKLWVGSEIKVSIKMSAVMAMYVIIYTWNGIFSNFLNGVGKVKLQLYLALIGCIINIPLAIYLGKNLGIYGVVLSTTIISIFSAVLLPIQYNKIIKSNTLALGQS